LLGRHPDVAGVHNAGGGTLGIAAALKGCGLKTRVRFICHKATDANKQLLLDGTADAGIDQNPQAEACEASAILAAAAQGRPYTKTPLRLQQVLR
jgi:LacI family transcriptional regulator